MAKGTLLKAFVKYTGQNKIIPGSLVVQHHKPKSGLWKEIPYDLCCDGGGGCNNCTPGTVSSLSYVPIQDLDFPNGDQGYFIDFSYSVNSMACPGFIDVSVGGEFRLIIPGSTLAFNGQDIVNFINSNEIAKANGITISVVTPPGEEETFQVTVDTCSCLGIYLSGGFDVRIIPNQPG